MRRHLPILPKNHSDPIRSARRAANVFVSLLALVLAPTATAFDDLSPLSDEFDDAASLALWRSVWKAEGWGADQLLTRDINTSQPGRFVLVPHASTWYRDWRGVLEFKEITGDFAVTADVEPRRRSGPGAPQASYSLAGIMVRAPRPQVTSPATWTPGGENYVFLSLGTGDSPGQFQFEVKTTRNSDSVLTLSPGVPKARIQVARIGPTFLMLRQNDGEGWRVHRRYTRPDFPATVQAGLTTYTDWPTASGLDPFTHNQTVIRGGNPDLVAAFEFVRFARPRLPQALHGLDLGNPALVTDEQLLGFLGESCNVPGGASVPPAVALESATKPFGSTADAGILASNLQLERSYRIQRSSDLRNWEDIDTFVSSTSTHRTQILRAPGPQFFRAISP